MIAVINIYHRYHNSPTPVPNLSQINPLHAPIPLSGVELVPRGGQRESNRHSTHCHNIEQVSLQVSVVCGSAPVMLSAIKYWCVPFVKERQEKCRLLSSNSI